MKRKIAIIIFTSLLIASTLPIVTAENVCEKEPSPSSGLAPTSLSNEQTEYQSINEIDGLNIQSFPFYGYCAVPSGKLDEGPVSFNSTSPEDIKQIEQTSSSQFISGGTWALGKWYGCEYAWGDEAQPLIWTIHPAIGEMTIVGNYDPEGTKITFNGLAYDHVTEIMYGCSHSSLYEVNIDTGASSWVGDFGISDGTMIAIAFDGSGELYGIELNTDSLYSIDPKSGESIQIGSGLGINLNYAQDMAFDIDDDILYLSAYTIEPVKEGALYTCDKETGIATKVGTFQGAAEITGFAIPYSGIPKIISTSIEGGVLKIGESKVQCTIKNIGGKRCENVTLELTSKRGLIFGVGKKPVIYYLKPGETVNLTSQRIYGIGLFKNSLTITTIQVTSEKTYSITKDALIFGRLWWC
jgi:hypothetical protein